MRRSPTTPLFLRSVLTAIIATVVSVTPIAAQSTTRSAIALSLWQDSFQITPTARSATRTLMVDATSALSVRVLAASQTLSVKLTSPAGAVYTVGGASTSVFQSSVTLINSTSTKPGASYLCELLNPTAGTWTVTVAETGTLTATINVIMTAFLNNSVRLVLLGGTADVPAGANVRIALVAFDGKKRLSGLTIKAQAFRPFDTTSPPVAVTFRDDGGGADEKANDGIYEAFVVPAEAGNFQVQADASGTASTGAFKRSAAVNFRVVTPLIQINGYTDQGQDSDGDGLLNRVVVTLQATVSTASSYEVSVRLKASNGKEVVATTTQGVATGAGTVDVDFDATRLVEGLGVDGPYTIAEVRWYEVTSTNLVLAGVKSELGQTHPYTIALLQHPRIRLSGAGESKGVDLFGTKFFEFLDVRIGIIVDDGGAYSYSASLTDQYGHPIGFVTGAAQLGAGTNTLTFRFLGAAINQNGADGPYILSDLLVVGEGHSLIERTAFTTSAFKASAFVPFRRRAVNHGG